MRSGRNDDLSELTRYYVMVRTRSAPLGSSRLSAGLGTPDVDERHTIGRPRLREQKARDCLRIHLGCRSHPFVRLTG
jgi:hypothetical protein